MFPFSKHDSEDPTTQIAWPTRQHTASSSAPHDPDGKRRDHDHDPDGSSQPSTATALSACPPHPERARAKSPPPDPPVSFTTWDLFTLSVSMAGAQVAWTVELGYGTPFLLSLGVSEQVTSLVWLAGPISGLVAQPLIGAISDSSSSRYRRRYWVCLSTVALVASTLTLAYCQSIAALFVDLYGGGAGDWDPERDRQVTNVAIGTAVFSFYVLDFALNALQASLRNLLLDITPPAQINAGNAWHSRMTQAGSIVGYAFGFFPLAKLPFLSFLGGDQFRKFCIVCIVILVITVWLTCWFHDERSHLPPKRGSQGKLSDALENIYNAIFRLPIAIRRVCIVQLCGFMGWFPFLFYSTTYVGQILAYQLDREPDLEYAARQGEFAMLLCSIVAMLAGWLCPRLTRCDERLFPESDDDDDTYAMRLRIRYEQWQNEAAERGKPVKLPHMPVLLHDVWAGAMLLFSVLMFSTFWTSTVSQATVMISLVGISWGVACWAPFTIVMQLIREMNKPLHASRRRPGQRSIDERDPLLEPSLESGAGERTSADGSALEDTERPLAGGTVLGLHNLAIVSPQFIIAIVGSFIFRIVDGSGSAGSPPPAPTPDLGIGLLLGTGSGMGEHTTYYGKNGVAWVLRFGGLCSLAGAFLARNMPPTNEERQMAHAIAVLEVIRDEAGP